MSPTTHLLTALVLLLPRASCADELGSSLREARRTYDLTAAIELRALAREPQTTPNAAAERLLAEACLLVAELHRLEFEKTPEGQRAERRRRGELIDDAAREGLQALEGLEPVSVVLQMRSDLLATLIRSKFRGKKYRRQMESAARLALEADPGNALAWVSQAKPLLFRPQRDDDDLRAALDLLEQALALDPTLESARLLRGKAYAELGEIAAAQADWLVALRANPDCTPARELLEKYGADA